MADEEKKPVYSPSEVRHYEAKEAENKARMKVKNEVMQNNSYKEYLSAYRNDTQQSFLNDFIIFKADYEQDADWYFKHQQSIDLKFHVEAEKMLWHIQQKKLFDLQCLWRAEKINLKGVNTTHDFKYWSKDIKRCPFLEPITEREAEILLAYVSSLSYEKPLFGIDNWQDYEDFTTQHQGDEETLSMPEWYHFYNMRMGTESLMILPDIRGKKEEEYIQMAIKYRHKNKLPVFPRFEKEAKEEKEANDQPEVESKKEEYDEDDPPPYKSEKIIASGDRRPFLGRTRSREFTEFINLFEDDKLKDLHQMRERLAHRERQQGMWDRYELNQAMELLRLAGDNYPIESYYSWRDAVINLATKFERESIAKALPEVYGQYKVRIESGIAPFVSRIEKDNMKNDKLFSLEYRELVLLGRKLSNEPENFD